ncbi:MAG: DUF4406 domain-containing protein [Candidatus Niyogibacteria bacterium]|nr:DUF4406 domain-containing protein [Candidatus Niyogibacteria bacterium]
MIAHLTAEDRQMMVRAKNFSELAEIALRIIHKVPYSLTQVCGSITTGGGTRAQNMRRFALAIDRLSKSGECMFSQMPFEKTMERLVLSWNGKGYCWPVLEEFYRPIFESQRIQRAYFLPRWEKSTGATWEHDILTRLGIEIWMLPDGVWYDRNILD